MNFFKGQNLFEFTERFKIDLDCMRYLSEIKWKDGFNRACDLDVPLVP